MCYLSKLSTTSRFAPLFLAHGNVVVGFAIFHIAYSKKKKKKKRKKKRHSSMVCECWWAPDIKCYELVFLLRKPYPTTTPPQHAAGESLSA
jgi:hypothetical protein